MKQGRTLTEMAQELERQVASKRDFVAQTKALQLREPLAEVDEEAVRMQVDSEGYAMTPHCHRQVGQWAGIHAKYYDKMLAEAPQLLCANVNHWMGKSDDRRLLRTIDGKARAWMSDRYRIVDNYEVAEAVLPILKEAEVQIESCQVTENRMYIKAVKPDIQAEVWPEGVKQTWGEGHHQVHVLKPGIVISNSEIGLGAINVSPASYEVHCSNLAVWSERALRKYHIGKALSDGTKGIEEYMSAETRDATNRAIMLQVRDMTQAALTGDIFDALVEQMRKAAGQEIKGDLPKVIEAVAELTPINIAEQSGVLRHLAEGGDLSRYGLHAAVTRFSQDVDSYDRATELEAVGANILAMNERDWDRVAIAA